MNEKIKCSKDNRCQECKEEQQKQLAKCEDWEAKWKAKVEKFEFVEAKFCPNQNPNNPSRTQYSSFVHGYNYKWDKCPSCQAVIKIIKSNGHGDQTEELKEHAANCQQHKSTSNSSKQSSITTTERERERERERESSSSKPNYLPWILGGIGMLGLIGIVVYFATRKGENK